ncbi:MAG TPA: hypothetical protein VIM77_04040 [Mucilaginibacter sp.]
METKPRDTNPITGEEGAVIDLDLAASWTKNHRQRNPNDIVSQFFGQKILNSILQQEDCLGIRIYYANKQRLSGWQKFWVSVGNFFIKVVANAEGEKRFVITGVLASGEDQLPMNTKKQVAALSTEIKTFKLESTKDYAVGNQSMPCPGSAGCPKNLLSTD